MLHLMHNKISTLVPTVMAIIMHLIKVPAATMVSLVSSKPKTISHYQITIT